MDRMQRGDADPSAPLRVGCGAIALAIIASLSGCSTMNTAADSAGSFVASAYNSVSGWVGTAMATPAPPPPPSAMEYVNRTWYACCNLRFQRDDITDANWTAAEMVPAGTPVRVIDFNGDGRNFAWIEAGGRRFRLIHDYSARTGESFRAFLDKVLLSDDPQARIAAYPPAVREAIASGRIARGMTREQVIVSLGHPPRLHGPALDTSVWQYWLGRFDPYDVVFDESGRVKEVAALVQVRDQVIAEARR